MHHFSLIFVSCGEGYVGQTKEETTSSPTATGSNEAGESNSTNESDVTDKLRLDNLSLEPEFSASIAILAKKSYVDPDANSQLNRTAMLPGMRRVVGQPDLHPGTAVLFIILHGQQALIQISNRLFLPLLFNTGNQYPIGATFITQKYIYPPLIGNDIVCFKTLFFWSLRRSTHRNSLSNL